MLKVFERVEVLSYRFTHKKDKDIFARLPLSPSKPFFQHKMQATMRTTMRASPVARRCVRNVRNSFGFASVFLVVLSRVRNGDGCRRRLHHPISLSLSSF